MCAKRRVEDHLEGAKRDDLALSQPETELVNVASRSERLTKVVTR